ncbi:hypothetical protein EDD16DRAFT_1522380 [Pisolithus croceorrhizus]|nr:hypothetical protein EDD16DRAFT_1522380 [Pisolithus croceorrhizus]KAI6160166.1 hypothetical protein EDD17DRAFT_1510702 [Pisolithus thermaeus]
MIRKSGLQYCRAPEAGSIPYGLAFSYIVFVKETAQAGRQQGLHGASSVIGVISSFADPNGSRRRKVGCVFVNPPPSAWNGRFANHYLGVQLWEVKAKNTWARKLRKVIESVLRKLAGLHVFGHRTAQGPRRVRECQVASRPQSFDLPLRGTYYLETKMEGLVPHPMERAPSGVWSLVPSSSEFSLERWVGTLSKALPSVGMPSGRMGSVWKLRNLKRTQQDCGPGVRRLKRPRWTAETAYR